MSHSIADILSTSISKDKKPGFVLATKVQKGNSIECIVDDSDERMVYNSIEQIASVSISGKFVHFDVGYDELIEVNATDYIKLA